MTNFDNRVSSARTWATGHLVLAGVVALCVGVLIGAVLF
jgi:hypothetical protein